MKTLGYLMIFCVFVGNFVSLYQDFGIYRAGLSAFAIIISVAWLVAGIYLIFGGKFGGKKWR
jgi:hypothetical protein